MAKRCISADERKNHELFMNYNFKNGHEKLTNTILNGDSSCLKFRTIYRTIEARLESFNDRIPTIKAINSEYIVALLALAGFFSNKEKQKLTCFYCCAETDEKYEEQTFLTVLNLHTNLHCSYWNEISGTIQFSVFKEFGTLLYNNNEMIESLSNPEHKNCNTIVERLRRCKDLISNGKTSEIKSSILAIAGFFIACTDKINLICFYCGVLEDKICNREIQLSEVHKKDNSSCPFAKQYLPSHIQLKIVIIESLDNFSSESVRFRSFDNYKSYKPEVTFNKDLKEKFARVGLYWTQNERHREEIKCYFCHFRIVALTAKDIDPVALHCQFQSSCFLLNRQRTNNIPIDDELFQKTVSIKPYFRQYETTKTRLNKFQDMIKVHETKEPIFGILAISGFFGNHKSSKLKCFYCNVVADISKVNINVLCVHIEENRYCPFFLNWKNKWKTLLKEINESKRNEIKLSEKYYSEDERVKSFDGYACKSTIIVFTAELIQQYALAGFYWTQRNEEIKCSFCNIKLELLTEKDIDPIVTHLRQNASCSLMRLDEPRNIPKKGIHPLAKFLFRTKYFKHLRNTETRLESFHQSRFENEADRKTVFSLGLAGFFNINGTNKVVCFYCYFEADISEGRHQILRNHKNHDCENKKQWIVTGNPISKFYLEAERRKSFEYYACSNKKVDFNDALREQYALVGFYSTSRETEEIKCAFCNLTLDLLNDDSGDPVELHRSKSNSCSLMKLQEPKNIPIKDELLQKTILTSPLYLQYESTVARLDTFDKSNCDEEKSELLVTIGFFNSNTKIICYYCGVTAKIDDDVVTIINKHYENNKCCPSLINFYTFIETIQYISCLDLNGNKY